MSQVKANPNILGEQPQMTGFEKSLNSQPLWRRTCCTSKIRPASGNHSRDRPSRLLGLVVEGKDRRYRIGQTAC